MAHPLTRIAAFNYHVLTKNLAIPEKSKPYFENLLAAYQGDYWQKGAGSLLPPPIGSTSSQVLGMFEKRFVFRNVIRECMERVSGAFFGKSPNWGFSEQGKPAGSNDELERALGEFWTRENVSTTLSLAFESRLVSGRGGLRVYIPAKFKKQAVISPTPDLEGEATTETGTPDRPVEYLQFPDMESALRAIKVEYIPPDRAMLLDDDAELFSIVKYSKRQDWETSKDTNVVEFSFVDDSNLTFIGVMEENETAEKIEDADLSSGLDLNGMTTFNEFKGLPYATIALYKNNQLLNLALTCAGFSLVDNGFGEVFYSNVELETERVTDPTSDSGYTERPKDIKRGGGLIQNLVGITTQDPTTGAETRTTPSVTFKEPSSVQAFKDGKDLAYTACLEEVGQLYAKISGDATASGESRVQAMTDYWLRIRKYKPEVDEMGSWALTVVTRLAAALCGQAEQMRDTTVAYDSKIFIGQVSSSEQSIIIQQMEKGIISQSTGRVLLGVEDPDLEVTQIREEIKGDMFETPPTEFDKRLDMALKMSGTFDNLTILKYLGVKSDAEAQKIIDAIAEQNAVAQKQFLESQNLDAEGNPIPEVSPVDEPQA